MADYPSRKLAVILHADVVGSTELVQRDETLAHHRIQDTFGRLSKTIANYGGIAHEVRGDALVAEFNRASDAVSAALSFQAANQASNAALDDDIRPELRVGIGLGEVVIADHTVTGAGVVLAQRLEQLAEPGGVCVQGAAYETVPRRLPFVHENLGERKVKGFEEPVRACAVSLKPGEVVPAPEARRPTRKAVWPRLAGAMIALVIVVGAALVWWQPWKPSVELASTERMVLALPDKPSIAVLPFTNMSDDREQEFFADGMTDDLITDLSKISGLFVIARNSTFTYKGKTVKVRQVAEELGVRYVVEGSVRRAGEKIRVNAQLIDAMTGGHVWADRFDGQVHDIFSAQDDFVHKIIEALALNLTDGEEKEIASGQTDNLEAWEAFQRGWSEYLKFTPAANAQAIAYLETAIELDPAYGRAFAALALAHYRNWDWIIMGGASSMLPRTSWLAALSHLEEGKKYPTALLHVGFALQDLGFGRNQSGLDKATRAISLDPNEPEAHIAMAWALIASGKPQAGLEFIETAARLNPSRPVHYELPRGVALFAMGDLPEARSVFKQALDRSPDALVFVPPLAATYAHLGLRQEAQAMLLRWKPDASQLELESFPNLYRLPIKWDEAHKSVSERIADGLHIAALPLDVTVSNLVDALRGGDPFARLGAARSLGRFGAAAAPAVPDLVEALADEVVRMEAAISLGKIGPRASAAVPALTAIQDESLVGHYAKEALVKITNE